MVPKITVQVSLSLTGAGLALVEPFLLALILAGLSKDALFEHAFRPRNPDLGGGRARASPQARSARRKGGEAPPPRF